MRQLFLWCLCHSSESQRCFLIIVWIPAECPVLKNLTEE